MHCSYLPGTRGGRDEKAGLISWLVDSALLRPSCSGELRLYQTPLKSNCVIRDYNYSFISHKLRKTQIYYFHDVRHTIFACVDPGKFLHVSFCENQVRSTVVRQGVLELPRPQQCSKNLKVAEGRAFFSLLYPL